MHQFEAMQIQNANQFRHKQIKMQKTKRTSKIHYRKRMVNDAWYYHNCIGGICKHFGVHWVRVHLYEKEFYTHLHNAWMHSLFMNGLQRFEFFVTHIQPESKLVFYAPENE